MHSIPVNMTMIKH